MTWIEPFTLYILATFGGPLLSIRRIVAWPQLKFISLGFTHCLPHRYDDDDEHGQQHQNTAYSNCYHCAIAHRMCFVYQQRMVEMKWKCCTSNAVSETAKLLFTRSPDVIRAAIVWYPPVWFVRSFVCLLGDNSFIVCCPLHFTLTMCVYVCFIRFLLLMLLLWLLRFGLFYLSCACTCSRCRELRCLFVYCKPLSHEI